MRRTEKEGLRKIDTSRQREREREREAGKENEKD